jgi:formylglycine-generating enzyme
MMGSKISQTGWKIVKRSWPAYVASLMVVVVACSSAPQKRSLASPIAVTVSESEIYVLRSQGDQIELIQCEDYTTFKDGKAAQECLAREGTEAILIPKDRFKKDLERALLLPEGYGEVDKKLVETGDKDLSEEEARRIDDLRERKRRLARFYNEHKEGLSQEKKREITAEYQKVKGALSELSEDVFVARAEINKRIAKIIETVLSSDNLLKLSGMGDEKPFAYYLIQSYIKLARTEHKEAQSQAATYKQKVESLVGKMVDISAHVDFPVTVTMGSPGSEVNRQDDETQHPQTITKAFYMGVHEVTQWLWCEIMGTNQEINLSRFKVKKDHCPGEGEYDETCGCINHPVEKVSWNDISGEDGFIDRLNTRVGLTGEDKFRLPTEAEWELAARAGTTTPFNLGENISTNKVNYDGNYPYYSAAKGIYREQTVAVGSLPNANAWGLYDMHGNVWEWVQDWYDNYQANPHSDYAAPVRDGLRVIRGGGWNSYASYCLSASRSGCSPGYRNNDIGFRLVRTK